MKRLLIVLAVNCLLLAACETPSRAPVQEQAFGPASAVLGEWKEYWETPDVKNHDLYRIIRSGSNGVKVQILDRDPETVEAHLDGRVLTFTQQMSFAVRYALTLQKDGGWLIGTATTPDGVVKVKWEKTN